jgi:uncharacterized protein (DUF488 family)
MTIDHIFTIGFTQKSAKEFFDLIKNSGARRIVDTRLNNTGQLAGFSKRDDLEYFLRSIIGAEYFHWIESAPEEEMLSAYKKKQISWPDYEREYLTLMERRKIHSSAASVLGPDACLLCSEAKPHHCHRRLLAEYLCRHLGTNVHVKHLV